MYKLELKKKGKIIKSVDDWYNAAPPKNPSLHWKDGRSAKELFDSISGNKFTRVNSLYNDIYGYDLYKNMELRYQLLTATEGILKEAKKANASKAVLLVITLKKEGCYSEKKVEANLQDLKNFVTSLGTPLEDGQYNLPVYPDIDFYVEHVEVEV